jgi:hypothetical protein
VYEDCLRKHTTSTVYRGGGKASLSLCFGGLSPMIKRGLVTCGKKRLQKKKETAKLILIRGIR